MNVWTGTARLGRDAEVRQTGNGTAVASFAAAADSGFGENKQPLWLDCSLFGKRAESGLIQYLVKGKQVALSGELGTRQFTKRDGTAGFAVTLRVVEIDLVGGQGEQGGGYQQSQQQRPAPQPQYQAPQPAGGMMDDDMDIPF